MRTIAENLQIIRESTADIKSAITEKGGTISGDLSTYADAIRGIPQGGGGDDMPVIGDGKTYLYITIAAEGRMYVQINFNQSVANGVVIDWGDGSAKESISRSGNISQYHTYPSVGDYVISLDVVSGTMGLGQGSSSSCIMGFTNTTYTAERNVLRMAEVGNNASVSSYAFKGCYLLKAVTLSSNVTSIGSNAFADCYFLSSIAIPDSVTTIGASAFHYCYSLSSIEIPNSVTTIGMGIFRYCYTLASVTLPDRISSIGESFFQDCYSLASIVLPDNITTIGSSAFAKCYALASIVFPSNVRSIMSQAFNNCSGVSFFDFRRASTIPSLSNTNAFQNLYSYCQIVVPDNLYDGWITASNWATYASKIIKASDFEV